MATMAIIRSMKNFLLSKVFDRMHLYTISVFLDKKRTSNKLLFEGKLYPFLFHSYNNMGVTERSVEIPIIYHYLLSRKFSRVLEIGNVTNYYEDYFAGAFPNKTVVDKIERNYNVITSDIAKYESGEKFDFIFSISTFEHMDSDLGRNPEYKPGNADHGTIAADNIIHCYENLLAADGLMVITAPMGYTPEWDQTFQSDFLDKYPFRSCKRKLFKRTTEQDWIYDEGTPFQQKMSYGKPYPYANYISVIELTK